MHVQSLARIGYRSGVFGSKSVGLISDVSSNMDLGCLVRVSSVESVLPGLNRIKLQI